MQTVCQYAQGRRNNGRAGEAGGAGGAGETGGTGGAVVWKRALALIMTSNFELKG